MMRKSLAQILLLSLTQCWRYSRWRMSQYSGSNSLRIVSAYDFSLAVKTIISKCLLILLRKLIANGRRDTKPLSIGSNYRLISMSQGLFLSSEQCRRVSSKSNTSVFFPLSQARRGRLSTLLLSRAGRERSRHDFSISNEMAKCSFARSLMPTIALASQAIQQVLILCAQMILSLLFIASISFFWLSKLIVLSYSFWRRDYSPHLLPPEDDS